MERGPSTGHPTQPAAGTVSAADGRATAAHGDPEDPGHSASNGNLTPLHQFLNTETGRAVPWGPSPGAIVMMRTWHSLCALLVTGLCIAAWAVVTSSNEPKRYTYSYDEGAGLELNTYGCDIRMLPSDTPSLSVDFISGFFLSSVTPATTAADSSVLRLARFQNLDGCAPIPYDNCSRRCLVTIGVSPQAAAASFEIFQDTFDAGSFPSLTVAPNVSIGRLTVGTWYARAPSISVEVQPGATIRELSATLVAGNLWTRGAEIGSLSASARGGAGSIYVLDVPSAGRSAGFAYRQPSNMVCAATNLVSGAAFVPDAPWANCDADESILSDAFSFDYNRAVAHFDADRSQFISQDEAADAMSALRCCGSRCPHNSNCRPDTVALFPPVDSSFFDRFVLTASNFFANVVASNRTWMVGSPGGGGCFERVTALTPGGGAAREIGSLYTDRGEILVTVSQQAFTGGPVGGSLSGLPANELAEAAGAEDGLAALLFQRRDKPSGWRLAQPDAARLMQSYGAEYGDRGSEGTAFLTIDVQGGPGTPRLRFVYSTSRAYLALMPSDLRLVSLGLMEPELIREQVRMLNADCLIWSAENPLPGADETYAALEGVGFNDTALSARHNNAHAFARAAFEEIGFALKSLGKLDGRDLRGELILLGEQIDDWGVPNLYTFLRSNSADVSLRRWTHASERAALLTAAILAAVFGVVCGAAFTYALLHVLHHLAVDIHRCKRRYALLQVQRAGIPTRQILEVMDSMGEALKPPHPVPICVFYSIFTLIDDLLIRPLRLRLTGKDSIGAFVRARVVLSRSGGVYADASQPAPAKPGARRAEPCLEPLATLERFLSAYAMYCLETDVEPLLADEVVRAIKAPGVGLAVHQYTARQIRGLRWLTPTERDEAVARLGARAGHKTGGHPDSEPGPGAPQAVAEHAVKEAARAAELRTADGFPREHVLAIAEFVAVSCGPATLNDVIELEDRPRVCGGGTVESGFRSRFDAWCRASGRAAVSLEGHLWAAALPPAARFYDGVRVRMVCGGRWRDQARLVFGSGWCQIGPPGVNGPPSRSWYASSLFATLVHFALFLGPVVTMAALAMRVQDLWARTMAPPTVGGRTPALLQDAFQPSIRAAAAGVVGPHAFLLPVVHAALIEALVFIALTALRAAVYYCELPELPRATHPRAWAVLHYFRLGYAAVASVHMCLYVSIGAMTSCWLILGAALDPVRFLSYGAAVITVFSVVFFATARLVSMARRVRAALVARIMSRLASRLRLARIRLARANFTRQLVDNSEVNPEAADAARAELDALQREERALALGGGARLADADGGVDDDEVDAVEIFETIDVDQSGSLSTTELEGLFDALEMPIPDRYKRSMFAQLDVEGNGTVSASEFEAGWADMLETIMAQGLINAGLSTLQIVLAVLTLTLLVSLLIAFILVALSGWPRRTLESSVIESLLIAGVGAVASGRKPYGAEKNSAELNRVVRETLSKSEQAVKAKRD